MTLIYFSLYILYMTMWLKYLSLFISYPSDVSGVTILGQETRIVFAGRRRRICENNYSSQCTLIFYHFLLV